jgi:hypothetical protein
MDLVCHVNAAHAINFSHPETLSRIVDAYLRGQPLQDLMKDDRIIAYVDDGRNQTRV